MIILKANMNCPSSFIEKAKEIKVHHKWTIKVHIVTLFAVVLNGQVTSQHSTRFTEQTQIHWSLAHLQSMALSWKNTKQDRTKLQVLPVSLKIFLHCKFTSNFKERIHTFSFRSFIR